MRAPFSNLDVPRPFLDHLEELRWTLLRALGVFAIALLAAVPLAPLVIRALSAPFYSIPEIASGGLQSIEVAGAFLTAMKTALLTALILAAPFITFFVLRFVFPALNRRERHVLLGALTGSTVLFVVGALLAYQTTLRLALNVMLRVHHWIGVEPAWTVNSYIGFSLHLLLAFGLAFQLPVIVVLLGRLHMVSAEQLRRRRPHVVLGIFVAAMLLTPPDPLTQLLLAAPLVLLYELSLGLIALFGRRTPSNEEGELS